MPLSWNEIKSRAIQFSTSWADAANEDAEAKPFLMDFFKIFGIESRKFGYFEFRVKKLDERDGYIDLFWKQHILVEMKSRGKDLKKAYAQAKEYLDGIKQHELPRLILVSDFENFELYDLEEDANNTTFKLKDLVHNVGLFGVIAGYQKKIYKEQDPVNIKAAELLGAFHDSLKAIGYEGHALEVYLVRILFCLFAEDTAIFNKQQFQDYVEYRTSEDGSDLASKLHELFQVLNTPEEKRFKNLDEQLQEFPFINGKLFAEMLPTASYDAKMRLALLNCCYLDWSKISPAIFGAMFQSVMNPKERRNLGAHYTSEKNIMKLIKPLFLDNLWKEFESIKHNDNRLKDFHQKISRLRFLDPACGCGNFLVITYRELRLLELEILRLLNKHGQGYLNIHDIVLLNVDRMCGIELEEFPAQIAQVAMWLIDHQMNLLISNEFGQYFVRLPLTTSANIVHGNALRLDWESVVAKEDLSYILGNPPFVGSKMQTAQQRAEVAMVFGKVKDVGIMDYVSAWFIMAAKYIQGSKISVAFVSTNSITQGEQTSVLWAEMFYKYKISIHFAHRTFKWGNEAKGQAAVYVIITGFANFDKKDKTIFDYEDIKGEPTAILANNINPYLVDATNLLITKQLKPISNVPEMNFGNMPLDGGNLIFSSEKKEVFAKIEPFSIKYFRRMVSAYEFLNKKERWCLWLVGANPSEIKQMPEVMKRIEAVKLFRLNSVAPSTQKHAESPSLFRDRNNPQSYIAIPRVSSENRKYIPMGFFDKNSIVSDTMLSIPNATLYHFGILTSLMHMAWVKYVCGRLKSDYRYSKDIVYNNYPWPLNPTDKQKETIETAAQKVLDVRAEFPESSLADLYDPLTMPPALVKAHNDLDKAVDLAYRPQPFANEAKRIEYLFDLYEVYVGELREKEGKKK